MNVIRNWWLAGTLGCSLWACGQEEQKAVQAEATPEPAYPMEMPAPEPVAEVVPFDNTAEIDSLAEAIDMDVDNHPQAAAGNAFMYNPFGVEGESQVTFQEYQRKINSPVRIRKRKVRNRHYPAATDTIFTLLFDSSSISFYYPVRAQKYMLSAANLRSPNLPLSNDIRVGIPRQELLDKLQQYKLYIKEDADSITVSTLVTESTLVFKLQQGVVQQIRYDPYLD